MCIFPGWLVRRVDQSPQIQRRINVHTRLRLTTDAAIFQFARSADAVKRPLPSRIRRQPHQHQICADRLGTRRARDATSSNLRSVGVLGNWMRGQFVAGARATVAPRGFGAFVSTIAERASPILAWRFSTPFIERLGLHSVAPPETRSRRLPSRRILRSPGACRTRLGYVELLGQLGQCAKSPSPLPERPWP